MVALKAYLAMTPAQKAALVRQGGVITGASAPAQAGPLDALAGGRNAPTGARGGGKRPRGKAKAGADAYAGPIDTVLILHGRPAPKKNGDMIPGKKGKNGRSIILPNPQYRAWHRVAMKQLRELWGQRPALTVPVRLTVAFYEHPQQRFDLAGVFQAICDALQDARVLKNDRLVRQSGPMVILQDRTNPRIECRIETL